MTQATFSAIVLAGDRRPDDPLLQHTGAACKVLVSVTGGKAMLLHVLHALQQSSCVGPCLLVGPQREHLHNQQAINALLEDGSVQWLPPQATPSTSAAHALAHCAPQHPVLLTSGDHVFLSPGIVDYFCQHSIAKQADVTVGFAPYALVKKTFPQLKKTVLRFRDGTFCGCNLFAFITPAGRRAADHWRAIEQQRKSPWQLIKLLGWRTVLRYLCGRLSLDEALQRLAKHWGLRLAVVILPFAEAAIDVDSVADYDTLRHHQQS